MFYRYLFFLVLIVFFLSTVLCFAIDRDFNGILRTGKYPGDMPDIGAFEYVIGGSENITDGPGNLKIKRWTLSSIQPDNRDNILICLLKPRR